MPIPTRRHRESQQRIQAMTTLSKIQSARNPEFANITQAEVTAKLEAVMSGPTHARMISFVDPKACLKIAQLYIEYYLNESNLSEASEFADDALSLA